MISLGRSTVGAAQFEAGPVASSRVDLALLVCAFFLQRFTLAFHNSLLFFDIVPATAILLHQFFAGRLVIDFDRLVWFLIAWVAITGAVWLNFQPTMLPSFLELTLVYALFMLKRSSAPDAYKDTLRTFQFLAGMLGVLAIVQFVAQFAVDGRQLIRFFGIFPDTVFTSRVNTIIPIGGSFLIKSNGIFLQEPSSLSQLMALGILIEVLEFGRPKYLFILTLGLLLAYSGTGLLLLLFFFPLAAIGNKNARLPAVAVVCIALIFVGTGSIDSSEFTSRIGEFNDTNASGFSRYISPFWLAKENFDTSPLPALLMGHGSGTMDAFANAADPWYIGFAGTWIKLFYEYGLIGTFLFFCFLIACLMKSMCPRLVVAAILFSYVFQGGELLNTSFLIMMIVLCTLSGAQKLRGDAVRSGHRAPAFAIDPVTR
jgi:hypothetical protein